MGPGTLGVESFFVFFLGQDSKMCELEGELGVRVWGLGRELGSVSFGGSRRV